MIAKAGGRGLGVEGLSKKEKRTHRHGQKCGDYGRGKWV